MPYLWIIDNNFTFSFLTTNGQILIYQNSNLASWLSNKATVNSLLSHLCRFELAFCMTGSINNRLFDLVYYRWRWFAQYATWNPHASTQRTSHSCWSQGTNLLLLLCVLRVIFSCVVEPHLVHFPFILSSYFSALLYYGESSLIWSLFNLYITKGPMGGFFFVKKCNLDDSHDTRRPVSDKECGWTGGKHVCNCM